MKSRGKKILLKLSFNNLKKENSPKIVETIEVVESVKVIEVVEAVKIVGVVETA